LQQEGGLVWASLSLADRQAAGYPGRDDADLTAYLSSIDEAEIVVLFVEQSPQQVKVSWRAKPGYDVAQLAVQFGGGGHTPAAGATLSGSLAEVQAQVLPATQALLLSKEIAGTPLPDNHHYTQFMEV
jgi:phosphoesterase RecJ-like protein